jgi:uncharacterized protein involved in type VI secretion and phage assembly
MDDKLESGWARVSALGAGKDRGFLWMPEVNDEVLIAFEHGDFNRPYVMAGLWNGKDTPPEPFSGATQGNKSEIRMMKSRVGHIIQMVDGPSEKYIEIVDSAKGTTIKLDAQTNKLDIKSKSDVTIKSDANLKIQTNANVEIEATGNVTIKGNGNVDIQASGILNLKGSMVNIN